VTGAQEETNEILQLTKVPNANPKGEKIFPLYSYDLGNRISDPENKNSATLGELLIQFFKFFGEEFNFEEDCLSVRLGHPFPKKESLIAYTSTPQHFCKYLAPRFFCTDFLYQNFCTDFCTRRYTGFFFCASFFVPTLSGIEDPFIITENCARTCRSHALLRIRAEFKRAYELLLEGKGLEELFRSPEKHERYVK
jgi:hypothetical protein